VDFTDKQLMAFAEPATSAALFSDRSLRSVVTASYAVPSSSVVPPLSAALDHLEFGNLRTDTRTEIQHTGYAIQYGAGVSDRAPGAVERVDVLWRGAVGATSSFERATIGVESGGWLSLDDVDGSIPAPRPTDPDGLESARRKVVLDRIKALASRPDQVPEDLLDHWLVEAGEPSLTAFLASDPAAMVPLGELALSFASVPGTDVARLVRFPVAAAILIRDPGDAGFRVADFLAASQRILAQMRIEGIEPEAGSEDLPRGRPIVAWVVPDDWFDDDDWPGGDSGNNAARRADRIDRASKWLTPQGIALVPARR